MKSQIAIKDTEPHRKAIWFSLDEMGSMRAILHEFLSTPCCDHHHHEESLTFLEYFTFAEVKLQDDTDEYVRQNGEL